MSSGINLVKEYIAEHHGWQERTTALSGLLADAFVSDELLKHAMTESVKLRIPQSICSYKSLDPDKVKALATYMEDARGISFKLACRAIVTWGVILNKCSTSETEYLLQQSTGATNSSTTPVEPPPPSQQARPKPTNNSSTNATSSPATPVAPPPPPQPAQPQPTNSSSTNTASPPASPTVLELNLWAKVCRTIGGMILCVLNAYSVALTLIAFGDMIPSYKYSGLTIIVVAGTFIYIMCLFPFYVFRWIFPEDPATSPPPFFQVLWRALGAMFTLIVCVPAFVYSFCWIATWTSDGVQGIVSVVAGLSFYVLQYLVLYWLSPKAT